MVLRSRANQRAVLVLDRALAHAETIHSACQRVKAQPHDYAPNCWQICCIPSRARKCQICGSIQANGTRQRQQAGTSARDRSSWSPGASAAAAYSGRNKARSRLPDYVDSYIQDKLNVDELISKLLPLEEVNWAFELMHEGKVIRTVIHYDGSPLQQP